MMRELGEGEAREGKMKKTTYRTNAKYIIDMMDTASKVTVCGL